MGTRRADDGQVRLESEKEGKAEQVDTSVGPAMGHTSNSFPSEFLLTIAREDRASWPVRRVGY